MNINPSLLGDTSTSKLTQTNIFINYYLQKEKYNEFTKLRTYAKTIGLKYVWHRGRKFFTKKGDGERAYVFSTEDLDRILLQPQKINKITINTNLNSESGLQNDVKNDNNNNINKIIISQKVNSRKTNKVRGGKNQNENKIENNTKAKNKKTKNQKVTNTPIEEQLRSTRGINSYSA